MPAGPAIAFAPPVTLTVPVPVVVVPALAFAPPKTLSVGAPTSSAYTDATSSSNLVIATSGAMNLTTADALNTGFIASPPAVKLVGLTAVSVSVPTPSGVDANGKPIFSGTPTTTATVAGRFQIIAKAYTSTVVSGITIGHVTEYDLTYVRNAPTVIDSYSTADPFGSATAQITFPKLTGYDGPATFPWLTKFTDIDIYWVPLTPAAGSSGWITTPGGGGPTYTSDGTDAAGRIPVWSGFIASFDVRTGSDGVGITVQCQGALYQLDRYTQKPWFPPRPWSMEGVLNAIFQKTQDYTYHLPLKADLRVDYLGVHWPINWTKKFVMTSPPTPDEPYDAVWAQPWTGFTTRNTGDWSRCLTGFAQQLLALMYTVDGAGVTAGNQWTLNCRMIKSNVTDVSLTGSGALVVNNNPLRQPELYVRDRQDPFIHFDLWLGTPGVDVQLSQDSTQFANVIYGDGVGTDGTTWRNSTINFDGSVTSYTPLATGADVVLVPSGAPAAGVPNPTSYSDAYDDSYYYATDGFISEAYYQYGSNLDQDAGIAAAAKAAERDADPGWSGTIRLRIDVPRNLFNPADPRFNGTWVWGFAGTDTPPLYDSTDTTSTTISRFCLRGGMVMRLKGWQGDLVNGLVLHIASVEVDPDTGETVLTVDSRFRDLLTLEEAMARTRDPLTPSKMLQVNKRSAIVEDNQAPWNYLAGSGFITTKSVTLHKSIPATTSFPYAAYTAAYPPKTHPEFYVKVNANASASINRWSGPFPIVMSSKGAIRRVELAAYDANGNVLPVAFHFSLYDRWTPTDQMPYSGSNYSPFQTGAFYETQPNGQPWGAPNFYAPPAGILCGWGNADQKAGYSPGLSSAGYPVTGLLVDEGTFTFDFATTQNLDFKLYAPTAGMQPISAYTAWGQIYCEHPTPVYFHGRLFRVEPGSG